MNVGALAALLGARAVLRSHDSWTRDQLLTNQARALIRRSTAVPAPAGAH